MLNMEFDGAVDRVIAMIPDISDKVSDLFKKMGKGKKEDDVPTARPVDSRKTVKSSLDEAADVDESMF